jgi:hypothetical protein
MAEEATRILRALDALFADSPRPPPEALAELLGTTAVSVHAALDASVLADRRPSALARLPTRFGEVAVLWGDA